VWRCQPLSLYIRTKGKHMSRNTAPDFRNDPDRFKGQRIREDRKRAQQARDHAAAMARLPLADRLADAGIPTTYDFQQTSLR
jgi:hypothetical protein